MRAACPKDKQKIQFLSKPWFMAYNFWIVTGQGALIRPGAGLK